MATAPVTLKSMRFCLMVFLFPVAMACSHGGDSTGRDLESILAKPEYNRWKGTVGERMDDDDTWNLETPSWLERKLERIMEWLTSLDTSEDRSEKKTTAEISTGSMFATGFFSVVGYILLIVAAGFMLFAVYTYLRDRERGPPVQKGARIGVARALEEGNALAYNDAEWRNQADNYLERGDIRAAFRSLYLGLLSGLHEQGRIVFARNRTNWHYVRNFRGESEARRNFAEMTDLFDRVWYGFTPAVDITRLQEVKAQVARLLAEGKRHA